MPNVKETYAKFHDRGFEIVSVSFDTDVNKCRSYVKTHNMDWYHIADGGGWKTRRATKFEIHSIPPMYLLDANGVAVSTKARDPALANVIEAAMKRTPSVLGDISGKKDDRAQEKLAEAAKNDKAAREISRQACNAS